MSNEISLPFGSHAGLPLRFHGTDYLVWVLGAPGLKLSTGLRAAIRTELQSRRDCPKKLPPDPQPKPLVCPRCGWRKVKLEWRDQAGGRRAIRADCWQCGAFVCWAPQTPENIAEASRHLNDAERPRSV
jgi:hypothetical protein